MSRTITFEEYKERLKHSRSSVGSLDCPCCAGTSIELYQFDDDPETYGFCHGCGYGKWDGMDPVEAINFERYGSLKEG